MTQQTALNPQQAVLAIADAAAALDRYSRSQLGIALSDLLGTVHLGGPGANVEIPAAALAALVPLSGDQERVVSLPLDVKRHATTPVTWSTDEAGAIAQFCKRVGRDDCRRLAGDQREADDMFDAFIVLRVALADAGFAPR